MASIFLSYSSKDKFFVRELAERLRSYGVKVWLDETELNIGDSLIERIGNAIDKTEFLGIVLSKNSVNSKWVEKELQIALQKELNEKRVVVLPLLIEPVKIPPFLIDKKYADFTDPNKYDEAFPLVLRALGVSEEQVPIVEPPKNDVSSKSKISDSELKLAAFDNIRIIDLDVEKSYNPDKNKALYNMYLKVSAVPPYEWEQIFEAERRFPRHTMWLRAWVEGQYLVVNCVPEELEKYHLRDLREDTESANEKYRKYLIEQAMAELKELNRQMEDQDILRDLKQRLEFDNPSKAQAKLSGEQFSVQPYKHITERYKYGIRISQPIKNATVGSSFSVKGTLNRLPDGAELWTCTYWQRGNEYQYWPQEPAEVIGNIWSSKVNHISEGIKEILVFVVGINGQALLHYFKRAGEKNSDEDAQRWPSILFLTTDMIVCDYVNVNVK